MPNRNWIKYLFFSLVLLIVAAFYGTVHFSRYAGKPIQEAEISYQAAYEAPNVIQRSQDLNEVLRIYTEVEEQYHPTQGTGKLYQNMATVYADLEQYPWAALYFYQARALMPRDQQVEDLLNNTLAQLKLAPASQDSVFRKVFFFHYYLSVPERLQILIGCTLLLLSFASLYLWKRFWLLKSLIAGAFLIWAIFFSSVIYSKYFEPLEGVIVKASMLYRDTQDKTAFVMEKPLMEGHKVVVLDVLDQGRWLKIRMDDGTLGFIPYGSIRLIKI